MRVPAPSVLKLRLPAVSVLKSHDPLQEEFTVDEDQEAGAARPTDALLYATPQQLLGMEAHDPAGLMRRFKQALDHIRESGRLRPSDLQLPSQASPPTYTRPIAGYEGGAFDPHTLGVACIVVPPTHGRGPYSKGEFSFNPDAWHSETREAGLVAVRMAVRPHKGKPPPDLAGRYYKFMLGKPPVDFLVSDPAPAATRSREPFVLMHMRLQHTRVVVPEPATAVDDAAHTPTDLPSTGTLAAGSETALERPESPEQVTGLIEHFSLAGAAANSDGWTGTGEGGDGALYTALALMTLALNIVALDDTSSTGPSAGAASELDRALAFMNVAPHSSDGETSAGDGGGGAAASGGAAACAQCGLHSAVLKRCTRCLEVAYCGKK